MMDQIEDNEGIKVTFKDFISKYVKYLPLFGICVAMALIIAFVYLRYATPIYNAKASMLIKSEKNPYSNSNEEFESIFLYKGGSDVDNEIEILKSKNIGLRVADSLGLQIMYSAVGNVKTSLIYPKSPITLEILRLQDSSADFAIRVKLLNDKEFQLNDLNERYFVNQYFKTAHGEFVIRINEKDFSKLQYKEYVVEVNSRATAANVVLEGLKVSPIKDRSNVLLLSYQGIHPELASDILNRLMKEYRSSSIEDKNQIAIQTNNFINKRLEIIAEELGSVETNLQLFKQKNQVINPELQSELFLNNQSELEKQLSQSEIKLNIISYLQEYVNSADNQFSIVPSSLGIEDPVLMSLVKTYNDLQLKRVYELRTTTPSNPIIVEINTQIVKVREDIREGLRNVRSSTQLVKDQTAKKIGSSKQSLNTIPLKEKNLLDITRQQGIKQSLYLFLLQKREETAISLASTISNSQVLDAAVSSTEPIKPNPGSIKGIAIFLGLLIPAIFIYLKEILNDKLNGKNDIVKSTSAPVFGEIGHADDGTALILRKNSRDVISEQFRMIRTNLQYLIGKQERPVILVTSTFSGEGKSFVSINVGAVMALAGKRTVIIEFDIRKPKVVTGLGLPKSAGITNYIVGNQPMTSLAVPVPEVEDLFVIPCGPIPPNPAELLLDERIRDIFEYAKENFDIIIVDTAPVGLVSDAQVLSKYADCTFYIVRLNYTFKKHVHFINDLYSSNRLPKLALLVNDIKQSSGYYSYGNYNGYGYGYSYFDEPSPSNRTKFKRFFKRRFKRRVSS